MSPGWLTTACETGRHVRRMARYSRLLAQLLGLPRDQVEAIAAAADYFDRGAFKSDLARRVAIPSESQNPDAKPELRRYVRDEMIPALEALGFATRIIEQAGAPGPFLYAERNEGEGRPTVLGYGHGDVIRGLAKSWNAGIEPWTLVEKDGRYYGRGTADNKGQHTINLAALDEIGRAHV